MASTDLGTCIAPNFKAHVIYKSIVSKTLEQKSPLSNQARRSGRGASKAQELPAPRPGPAHTADHAENTYTARGEGMPLGFVCEHGAYPSTHVKQQGVLDTSIDDAG